MADSSAIDQALMAVLSGDQTLMALVPDGVFWEAAPPKATRFVLVSLVESHDEPMFDGRAYEDAVYLVTAVMLKTANGNIQGAAARMDVILEGATLFATGYTPMVIARESRVRLTEVDEVDDTIRWFHRGGHYRVVMST